MATPAPSASAGRPAFWRPRRWEILLLLAATAAVLLLAAFVDRPLVEPAAQLNQNPGTLLRAVIAVGSSSYYLMTITALGAALMLWRWCVRERRLAQQLDWCLWTLLFAFTAIALSGLLIDLIKIVVGRPRPSQLAQVDYAELRPFGFDARFYSFPSGHTSAVFALATALGFLLPGWRWPLLAIAALLASTRMMVSAHYLSDLVAGGALAIVVSHRLRDLFVSRRRVFMRCRDGSMGLRPAGRAICRRLFGRRWQPAARSIKAPARR